MEWLTRVAVFALMAGALSGQKKDSPASEPQYFDPPTFIVAGVIDYNAGGHGSDPIVRSAEVLTKAIASLGSNSPSASSSATVTEQRLREAVAQEPGSAALHHSLGEVEEKDGNAVEALREYRRAAELEANESHLFDLGAELLTHHAPAQAVAVFAQGIRLYPGSLRMRLGSAVASYSQGSFDQARDRFFEAADLSPDDPTPYLFLGKVQDNEIARSAGLAMRMERFVKLHPESAWANYYYAATLWKRGAGPEDAATQAKAEALLKKAVRLDPQLGAAWLQLGILLADRHDSGEAIFAWQNAIAADPQMAEARYRLAQAYRRIGESAKANWELELYQQLSKETADKLERERAQIKQFVFTMQAKPQ